MRSRTSFIGWVALGIVLAAWTALAQTAPLREAGSRSSGTRSPSAEPITGTNGTAIAIVGDLRIFESEMDARLRQMEQEYRARTRNDLPEEYRPLLRRQVLEQIIRQRLLMLEARRRGLRASYEEAESQLKRDPVFQQGGVFDEAKYLAIKSTQPAAFQSAIEQLRASLPVRRLNEAVEREQRPEEAAVRASVVRKMTTATIDFLPLRRAEFDGNYPEPREAELVAYARTHAAEYRRPEEARISLVQVDRPALADSLVGILAAERDWERHMQQRADSALAAIRNGATLEAIAAPFGGVRQAVVRRDNFPAYWRGTAKHSAAIFALARGTTLSEAVPAKTGRLLVRLDAVVPEHPAGLAEVAKEIRAKLRSEARIHRDDRELRGLYTTLADSLRGPAYRVRYAVADTALFPVAEPSANEIDRWYRGHLADYSFFDAASGTVNAKPLHEVRDDVRRRMMVERRSELVNAATLRLHDAWSKGRRTAALEHAMTRVREVGLVPVGGAVDTGLAGLTLGDTLKGHDGSPKVGIAAFPRGQIVYQVYGMEKGYMPTFEQARPLLAARRELLQGTDDEAGARKLWEADPAQFRKADMLHFSRLMIPQVDIMEVKLARAEVERYYHAHIDKYSAPELCRVRHILVSPVNGSATADAEARRKAEDLLRRVRAGEDFGRLAEQHSDDPATRESGGDVGVFRHGMMLEEFERVAFRMRPGDISDLVKTEVGYHILLCTEYVPADITPLKYCYGNVGPDRAAEKADSLTRASAERLLQQVRTPAQGRALARRLGLTILGSEHEIGNRVVASELIKYFETLETMKPGQVYPGVQLYRGMGYAITWMDTITPSGIPTWEQARERALDRYRKSGSNRAILAKKAELDSMRAAGWALDSLAALWGGFERAADHSPGKALSRLGGKELLDSLVFGRGKRPPVLEPGQDSGWIEFPAGWARLRLVERRAPDPVQLAGRIEAERRLALERNLKRYFDRLKQRYPVRILDGELRATALPPLPEP